MNFYNLKISDKTGKENEPLELTTVTADYAIYKKKSVVHIMVSHTYFCCV